MEKRAIFNEEHNLFRDNFRKFCEQEVAPNTQKWVEQGIVDKDIWLKAGAYGYLCTSVPEEYGGLGISDFRYPQIMIEELYKIGETGFCPHFHSELSVPYIAQHGSEALKSRLLPKCISGETILAIAMTEPNAGSDLQNIRTVLEKKDGYYLLNGSKTFVSNGILSDAIVVAAKSKSGISLCVVESGMEGFSRGTKLKKMGLHAQDTAEIFFSNVIIPKENIIGKTGMGFLYLIKNLAQERLACAVSAMASAHSAFDRTLDYVKQREAFGKPIGEFQNTRFKMAEMKTEITIGQLFIDNLVMSHTTDEISVEDACMAKYWSTELLGRVVDDCVQFHGGYGYMAEEPICKAYLDARVTRIFAGTNEIMKDIIGKSLGL